MPHIYIHLFDLSLMIQGLVFITLEALSPFVEGGSEIGVVDIMLSLVLMAANED